MKELYELTQLSDNDFLSFLYSERGRQESKCGAPGWSLWALTGSAFALVLFVYTTLKTIDTINLLLCYYIFTVFCPIVLYIIFLTEQRRMVIYGDSVHVERLKNIAPMTLLLCLMGIYGSLTILGVVLGAASESIVRCVVALVPLVMSFISIMKYRNKLVTTFFIFRVSAIDWQNKLLMFLVGGSLLLPLFGGLKHLAFGFSDEFEITFAVVVLIAIIYMLIRNKVNGNRVTDVDELIDGFLYRDWTRKMIMRKLELMRLGKSPFMELEKEYNKVVDASDLIKNAKRRAEEISDRIQKQRLKEDELVGLLNELEGMSDFITLVLNSQTDFHEKSEELIKLKSTLGDCEFRAMLDTAYDLNFVNQVFGNCHRLMDIVNQNIIPKIEEYIKTEEKACCEICHHRLEKAKKEYPKATS